MHKVVVAIFFLKSKSCVTHLICLGYKICYAERLLFFNKSDKIYVDSQELHLSYFD